MKISWVRIDIEHDYYIWKPDTKGHSRRCWSLQGLFDKMCTNLDVLTFDSLALFFLSCFLGNPSDTYYAFEINHDGKAEILPHFTWRSDHEFTLLGEMPWIQQFGWPATICTLSDKATLWCNYKTAADQDGQIQWTISLSTSNSQKAGIGQMAEECLQELVPV